MSTELINNANDNYYYALLEIIRRDPFSPQFPILLKDALRHGFPVDYIPDTDRPFQARTLFMISVSDNSVFNAKISRTLLHMGADPNKTDSAGRNGLMHIAATGVSTELFAECLAKTKDVNCADSSGYTALDLCCERYLKTANEEPMKRQQLWKIKQLLEAGAEINPKYLADPPKYRDYETKARKEKRKYLIQLVETVKEQQAQMENLTPEVLYEYSL